MTTATATTLKVFVAGKPVSVNSAYGQRGNRRFLTAPARNWKDKVTWEVYVTGARGRFARPRIAYRFQGVKADADNLVKMTQDAVAAALDLNDKSFQVASVSVEPGDPGCWIEIMEANQ